ncbi:DUF4326 domain-containing protein [Phytomonospora sp. NPDC050363]|uniref:DUF4326 domain-containing protein n=1 Tax=Phytomonospora sp. NPDC050363 TaxID=3155642 RepID=UPI0033F7C6C8
MTTTLIGPVLPSPPTILLPQRIRRQRVKGWKLPANAVIVCRPSRYGNPFKIAMAAEWGLVGTPEQIRAHVVVMFEEWLDGAPHWTSLDGERYRQRLLNSLPLLTGRDLACTCPLPEPGQVDYCHAVPLIRRANLGAPR